METSILIFIGLIVFAIVVSLAFNLLVKLFPSKEITERILKDDNTFDKVDWKDHKREEHTARPKVVYGTVEYVEILNDNGGSIPSHIEVIFPKKEVENNHVIKIASKQSEAYKKVINYMSKKKYSWSDLAHYIENSEIESQVMWNRIEKQLKETEFVPLNSKDLKERITKNGQDQLESPIDFLENYGLKLDRENTDNKHIAEYPLLPKDCYIDYKDQLVAKNVHPGEIIKFLINDWGMSDSLSKMSTDMGFAFAYLSHVIHGTTDISIKASIKLDKHFNQPPNFFINVQTNYIRAKSSS